MGLNHSAERRAHRRLIVAVLALGALFAMAAPQALASSRTAKRLYQPVIAIKATHST
jgi:hypothetical protein